MLMEYQHVTSTDWARKEIAGAAIHREWVGENDEELHFRGEVYPHFFARKSRQRASGIMSYQSWKQGRGWVQPEIELANISRPSSGGLGHLDVLDNMRKLGQAHALTRGDGWHLGWFVIERLMREHAHLAKDGIGQQIKFEVTFQRVPIPNDPLAYFPAYWGAVSP
jgi:phage protein U